MVVNACLDERRKRRRWLSWDTTQTPRMEAAMNKVSDGKPQERQYARLEVAEAVRYAIEELKPKFRLPILLKYIEGLSYEEIAEVMGCSKGTVASRLNRGHSQLAKRLSHLNNPALWGE
jgi:RNA polymerase sigma-70 factor (ECF subfamily)